MKTHKEGKYIIIILISVFIAISLLSAFVFRMKGLYIALIIFFPLILFVLRFFRVPHRKLPKEIEGMILSPADGKIVAVEEVIEEEYLKKKTIKVSVFMSVWNVHINWFPCSGIIKYTKYHPGKYLVARHPKSSSENERQTTVINTEDKEIVIRQIAGAVARRVVCYSKPEIKVKPDDELGFIKFGSRVDVFLPLNSEIIVQTGQKVKGKDSPLALLKKD